MKFMHGVLIGGMIATGVTLMYTSNLNQMSGKKMMKKGKQFAKKMGIM